MKFFPHYLRFMEMSAYYSHRFSKDKSILMENVVGIELLRRRDYNYMETEIFYWKDYEGKEVDFVIKEVLK